MQFPVSMAPLLSLSLSLSLCLSVVLNECLHTQSGKQTIGHFTAPGGVLSQLGPCCLIYLSANLFVLG